MSACVERKKSISGSPEHDISHANFAERVRVHVWERNLNVYIKRQGEQNQ